MNKLERVKKELEKLLEETGKQLDTDTPDQRTLGRAEAYATVALAILRAESSTYEPDGAVCEGPNCLCQAKGPRDAESTPDEEYEGYCCSGCSACDPEPV